MWCSTTTITRKEYDAAMAKRQRPLTDDPIDIHRRRAPVAMDEPSIVERMVEAALAV